MSGPTNPGIARSISTISNAEAAAGESHASNSGRKRECHRTKRRLDHARLHCPEFPNRKPEKSRETSQQSRVCEPNPARARDESNLEPGPPRVPDVSPGHAACAFTSAEITAFEFAEVVRRCVVQFFAHTSTRSNSPYHSCSTVFSAARLVLKWLSLVPHDNSNVGWVGVSATHSLQVI